MAPLDLQLMFGRKLEKEHAGTGQDSAARRQLEIRHPEITQIVLRA